VAVATAGSSQLPIGGATALKFPWPIGAYVVGVTGFQYQYPGLSCHNVLEVALSVDANLIAANIVVVQPKGIMMGQSGQNLDAVNSWVNVGVLAWSQDDTSVVAMTVPGITSATASAAAQIPPGSALLASQAILTGFNIVRQSEASVQHVRASVSSSLFTPLAATVRGAASISDQKGNTYTSATVDGAYFCVYNVPELELATWIGPTQSPEFPQTTETVPFAISPNEIALFLTGFSIEYPDPQASQVAFMVAGATQFAGTSTGASFIPQAAVASGPLTSNPDVATGWVSLVAVGIS
jgi:hypothetical protein